MTVIRIENLWKEYRLGVISHGTLTHDLQSWWAGLRGKDDPNAQLTCETSQSMQTVGDQFWALRDINLNINQGEVLGIIGRNGAGKSTLLKILSRVTAPSRGVVRVKGRIASLLEVGTGFHPELTGRENVFLNGSILGMSKSAIAAKFDEIVDFAELDQFIDTPVKRYSSGMYVRLAFAVAAHLETEIIVVDEVLAVGDVVFQKKCLGKMKDVSGAGRTVLFVSHNMASIKNLCSRVVLVDQGKLVMDADPDTVIAKYLDRNLIEGSVATAPEIADRIEGVIKHDFPYFRIQEIRLEDNQGRTRSVFDATQQIVVSVCFECLQQVHDLRVLIAVADENGASLYGSQNTDDCTDAKTFYELQPGTYRTRCILPKNIFANRTYYLNVDVFCPKKEHHFLRKILEFKVNFDGYNSDIQYGGNNLDLFFWPKLSWSVEKIQKQSGHARK